MIQDILTASIEIAFVGLIALFAVQFVSGFGKKSAPVVEKLGCEWNEERLTELYVEQSQDAQAEDWLVDAQQAPVLHPPMSWSDAVVKFSRPAKSATFTGSVADLTIALQESITATNATLVELKQAAWESMSPYELRKACQKIGFKWRNRHGRNKHAKKSEMITALKTEAIAS